LTSDRLMGDFTRAQINQTEFIYEINLENITKTQNITRLKWHLTLHEQKQWIKSRFIALTFY